MRNTPSGIVSRLGVGAACLSVGMLALTGVTNAATVTANLSISATVISSCAVTAGSVAFGNYDPTAGSNVTQSGTFTVACTKGTGAIVGLNTGSNASGSTRRMTNGTEFLTYELYKEAALTNVWGNAGGALVTLAAAASNAPQTLTVHGSVPFGQDVGQGSYTDTVLITVTF